MVKATCPKRFLANREEMEPRATHRAAHGAQVMRTWERLRSLEVMSLGMGRQEVSSSQEKGYQEPMVKLLRPKPP